uniref:TOG domain-containing protein n=1 Tax=Macrostomum lignano TaxID=282301 RepID=A0A1I8JA28_9PLAT
RGGRCQGCLRCAFVCGRRTLVRRLRPDVFQTLDFVISWSNQLRFVMLLLKLFQLHAGLIHSDTQLSLVCRQLDQPPLANGIRFINNRAPADCELADGQHQQQLGPGLLPMLPTGSASAILGRRPARLPDAGMPALHHPADSGVGNQQDRQRDEELDGQGHAAVGQLQRGAQAGAGVLGAQVHPATGEAAVLRQLSQPGQRRGHQQAEAPDQQHESFESASGYPTGGRMDDGLRMFSGDELMDNLGDDLVDNLGDELMDTLGDELMDNLGDDLVDNLEDELMDNLGDDLVDNLGDELMDNLGDDLVDNLVDDLVDNLGDDLVDNLEDDLMDNLGDDLVDNLEDDLMDNLVDELMDNLVDELMDTYAIALTENVDTNRFTPKVEKSAEKYEDGERSGKAEHRRESLALHRQGALLDGLDHAAPQVSSPIGPRSETAQHHQHRLTYISASSLQRTAASLSAGLQPTAALDQTELIREKSIDIVTYFVQNTEELPQAVCTTIVNILVGRLGQNQKDVVEPSEELRLKMSILLDALINKLQKNSHLYLSEFTQVIVQILDDAFHEVKKQACNTLSAKFEAENEEDLKDKQDFATLCPEHYPVPPAKRPNLGCRTLVNRNLSKILPPLSRDLTDWVASTRLKSAQLLPHLILAAESYTTQHLETLVTAAYRAAADDEAGVRRGVDQAIFYASHFAEPSLWWRLVGPHVKRSADGNRQLASALRVLTRLLAGAEPRLARPLLTEVAAALAASDVACGAYGLDTKWRLLKCLDSLVGVCDSAARTFTDWTKHSYERAILDTLCLEAGPVVGAHLPDLMEVFRVCLHVDKDVELRLKLFLLLARLCARSAETVDSCGQLPEHIPDIIGQLILPNCRWRAGRTAEAIRRVAVACLWTLLSAQSTTDSDSTMSESLKPVLDELLTALGSLMEDDSQETRHLASRCLGKVLATSGPTMDADKVHQFYPSLVKRLDDSSDAVRLSACEAWLAWLGVTAQSFRSSPDLYAAHLQDIYRGLLVHLDDQDSRIRSAVYGVLAVAGRLHSRLLAEEVQRVRHKHRDEALLTRLLDENIANMSETVKTQILPLALAPRGGVTGRPEPMPPYGNFFLSAGLRICYYGLRAELDNLKSSKLEHFVQTSKDFALERTHLKATHQSLINAHHGPGIVKLAAIVGRGEQRHQLALGKELVAVLNHLMGPADEVQIVLVQELGHHLGAEAHGLLVRVGPQQVAQQTLVRHVRGPHDAPDLLHGLQVRRQAAMAAEDFLVNDGRDWQAVETVEAVDPVDTRALVVSAQQEEVLRVLDLVGQQQADGLQRLLAAVHVVAEEKVVALRGEAAVLEQAQQIVVLAVNVTCGR